MIDSSNGKLMIFENFRILERENNKKVKLTTTTISGSNSHIFNMTSATYNVANQIVNFQHVHAEDLYIFQNGAEDFVSMPLTMRAKRIGRKFKSSWFELFTNPIAFFKTVKGKQNVIQNLNDEGEKNFTILLEQAQNCFQEALVDKLTREKNRIVRESALLAAGIKTFISEEDIISASKKASRHMRLDWIKNFTRVIPFELQSIVSATFEKELFDNYVILHYDPKCNGSEMTDKEKAKAKDPILFGVFKDSRRLYYLGDWIDEYCDLTLDKLLDIINKKHSQCLIEKNMLPVCE